MDKKIIFEALRNKKSVLVSFLNTMFDAVYVIDRERNIVFWNKGAEKLTGYLSDDVVGKKCSDNILNHIDAKGNLLCRNDCPAIKSMNTDRMLTEKVYPLKKSGNRFPVRTKISPLKDSDGNIIGVIEVFSDITLDENYRLIQKKFRMIVKKYLSGATMSELDKQVKSKAVNKPVIKDMTVLYVDIVDFTKFAESNSHKKVLDMLNNFFSICDVVTKKYNGDIDKFIGDAMMAIFIDPNDAFYAAKEILSSLEDVNKCMKKTNFKVQIRIGINSGRIIQGEIGTPERKDLTVIGDVVNTAARIESNSKPNIIAVSQSTYARLKKNKGYEFSEEIVLKGKKKPIKVYYYSL